MKNLKTTTNSFEFVKVDFYNSIASPENMFSDSYYDMPEYERERDFDYLRYCDDFIPKVQEFADTVAKKMECCGVDSIKVTGVCHPNDYNYNTDWMDLDIKFKDGGEKQMEDAVHEIMFCNSCREYFDNRYKTLPGYIFFGPEDIEEFRNETISFVRGGLTDYDPCVLMNMFLTLSFIRLFGDMAEEEWDEIAYSEERYYYNYADIELLIPDGSEYLFKDVYTAEADELYHHVFDKVGWAWRGYESETELGKMLKWAKAKGLTLDELRVI